MPEIEEGRGGGGDDGKNYLTLSHSTQKGLSRLLIGVHPDEELRCYGAGVLGAAVALDVLQARLRKKRRSIINR